MTIHIIKTKRATSYIKAPIHTIIYGIPALLLISAILILNLFLISPTHADSLTYSVTIDPSLNIALSSNSLILDLNPVTKAFATRDLDVTISSNGGNGYKLNITSDSNTTNLVNTLDSTKTISTLPIVIGTTSGSSITTYTESDFPVNKWGYKIGTTSTGYLPFISGTTIALNNTPTTEDTTRLTFASKIDYSQPSGLYSINLTLNGTVNPTSPPYMQNLDPSVCVKEHPTLVVDSRDNRSYYIQRLLDNKCWMIQNLRLGQDLEPVTGALILTDQDTNINTNDAYNPRKEFVLTNKLVEGKMPSKKVDDPLASDEIGTIWDDSAFYCTSYGCYYNFYTVTAGINAEGDETVTGEVNITTTICPKGWTLPTGNKTASDTSDLKILASAYAYQPAKIIVNPNSATENINGASTPGFTLGGNYHANGAYHVGQSGDYWTRSNFSKSYAHDLYFNSSVIYYTNRHTKDNGRSVRCLLQE